MKVEDNSKTSKKPAKDMGDIGTIGALSLSVASSVSIVIVNKFLISNLGYKYGARRASAYDKHCRGV